MREDHQATAIGVVAAALAVLGSLLPWVVAFNESPQPVGLIGTWASEGKAVFAAGLAALLALGWRFYGSSELVRPMWIAIAILLLGAATTIAALVFMARTDVPGYIGAGAYITLIGGLGLIGSGVLSLVQLKREEAGADDSG